MSPTSYRTAPPRVIQTVSLDLVGLGRFELPTSRLSGVRSNQLSYRPSAFVQLFLVAKKSHTFIRANPSADGGLKREGPCSFGGFYFSLRSTFGFAAFAKN
jgi:hypothetical protein